MKEDFLFVLIPLRGLLSALARHSVTVRSALAYSQPCSHLLKNNFLYATGVLPTIKTPLNFEGSFICVKLLCAKILHHPAEDGKRISAHGAHP